MHREDACKKVLSIHFDLLFSLGKPINEEQIMSDNLEDQFHRAMIDVYQNALRECAQRAAYFLEMVGRQGGVETARKLLQSDDIEHSSSALWECGRLHLMFEYLVLQPKYAELFTDEEKEMAKNRLKREIGKEEF